MSSLYYLAALYSSLKGKPYLVAGTSNKCELFVGYFTKGGDNVHDISVLADLTVEEVIKIGEYIKVPDKVLSKTTILKSSFFIFSPISYKLVY